MASLRWITLSALVFLTVTPARAGTLAIDFDLSSSVFTAFGAARIADGAGGAFTGSATVVLTGVNALGIATGMSAGGSLSSLRLDVQLALPLVVGGTATVMLTGPVSFRQMGSASGPFDGQAVVVPTAQAMLRFTSDVGCVGAACSAVQAALFRAPRLVVDDLLANAAPLAFGLAGLDAAGMAALRAGFRDDATSNVGVRVGVHLDISGREVARRFVDEPTFLTEFALGLGLLGVLTARRRGTV